VPSQSVEAGSRDEAIAAAREQFGPGARVVGVRRIRSGGMFGFFANERFIAEVEVPRPDPVKGPDTGSLLKVGARTERPAPSLDDRMAELAELLGAASAEAPSAGLYGRSGAAAQDAAPRARTAAPRTAAPRTAAPRAAAPRAAAPRTTADPVVAPRSTSQRNGAAAKPFTPARHTLMLSPEDLVEEPALPAEPVAERPAGPSPFAAALTRMVASSPVQDAADAAAEAAAEAAAADAATAAASAAQVAAVESAAAEATRAAAARIDAAAAEAARLKAAAAAAEAARLQAEAAAAEAARLQAEAAAAEAARAQAARIEAARVEAERIAAERIAAERIAAERLEAERLEAERLEAQRIAAEAEAARIEAARIEAARIEAEHLETQRLEAERIAAEAEAARIEAEHLETERLEAERLEAERLAAEAEAARIEAAMIEAERIEAERIEAARAEAARADAERIAAARAEAERLAAHRRQALAAEAERLEAARIEAARIEAHVAAQDVPAQSMVESVRTADEELAALLEEVLAANGSGRGRHRLPESLVDAAAVAAASAVVEAAAVGSVAGDRVLDVPQPWVYGADTAGSSAYDTGSYRTDAYAGAWVNDARIAQRAAQVAAAQNLVVDAVVVAESSAEEIRHVAPRPVQAARGERLVAAPVSLARTAGDPAPLALDATMTLPPLSLMPPQRFGSAGGRPPLLPAVPPARRGRPPVPAPVSLASRKAAELPAAEETGGRLATVTRLVPAVAASTALAPFSPDATEELVVRLLGLGLPDVLLGPDFTHDVAARGVYAALTRTLAERLPVAPRVPTGPGQVLMVVGPGAETFAAARSLALSLRLEPEDVQWAASGALAGLAPEGSRITSLETAAERQQASATRGTVTVIAVDAPLRTSGGPWLEQMLSIWSPSAVWAVLDSTRKPEDLVPWLDGLPRLDAVVVQDTETTADPAAVLSHVSVPVALVDGARATAHRWASLLCERLEELEA